MATTTVAPVATSPAAPGPAGQKGRWYEGIAAHVVLIAILLVALYPIAYMFGTSFKSPQEILNNVNVFPRQFSPGNYVDGWNGIPGVTFGTFFLNSAVVAIGVVVGNALACSLAAFAFARLKFPLRGFWFAIMIGTLLLPHHVLIVPQYVLFNSLEWINTPLPLIVPKFLATEAFFVFLMVQFMRGIPRSLDEAAEIDGCGPYRRFFFVVLPLTKPALVTTAVFSFIWTWNDFFTQLVYLNDLDSYTVPIGLRLFLDSSGQAAIAPMFAMSVLSLVPVFLFFLVFQRLIVDGINTSGIKG
ncbi:carbohydrate ABC transporter permease [Pseudonocardia cypriaca]|uniref:Carbohydrate ABC transporter membrane protein 2 (CUT1 family) n=1 Tax=Pseudonocardia cypriaca TaxID=882449 RepID=A0A543GIZ7_9PSEU|nr:carbohydrate ABC transporter permease [Pseudonocardia cypriaca]TQM46058.1 carbohydrate ABC transporter membrane protein 2 (CUT1 family) [Pseudonocardia cypriaca]